MNKWNIEMQFYGRYFMTTFITHIPSLMKEMRNKTQTTLSYQRGEFAVT